MTLLDATFRCILAELEDNGGCSKFKQETFAKQMSYIGFSQARNHEAKTHFRGKMCVVHLLKYVHKKSLVLRWLCMEWFRMWDLHQKVQIHTVLKFVCGCVCRTFTQRSVSTTRGKSRTVCPPPAPAWICSNCPSSPMKTCYGQNSSTPLSLALGLSSARPFVFAFQMQSDNVNVTKRH